jgi:hypothetical protein
MEFPPRWDTRPAEQFESTCAPAEGDISYQLLAQLRNTARILDGFQVVLDSNQICNTKVDLGQLILSMGFKVDAEILVFAARLRYLQEHVVIGADRCEGYDGHQRRLSL